MRGTVANAQGNGIPGATVTLTNPDKNFSRTQTTNDQGGFTFPSVMPDVYRVEVEGTGFKKTVVSDVRALVDTPTDVDVALEIGNVAETVDPNYDADGNLLPVGSGVKRTFATEEHVRLLSGRLADSPELYLDLRLALLDLDACLRSQRHSGNADAQPRRIL